MQSHYFFPKIASKNTLRCKKSTLKMCKKKKPQNRKKPFLSVSCKFTVISFSRQTGGRKNGRTDGQTDRCHDWIIIDRCKRF